MKIEKKTQNEQEEKRNASTYEYDTHIARAAPQASYSCARPAMSGPQLPRLAASRYTCFAVRISASTSAYSSSVPRRSEPGRPPRQIESVPPPTETFVLLLPKFDTLAS